MAVNGEAQRAPKPLVIDLVGQAVAVTGASSGIGAATALACARAGASVALAARRTDRIEQLAAQIADEGGTAIPIETDVADEAQARGFVAEAAERLGRLDALVNNAGVMLLGPFEEGSTQEWRRMLDVNVLGLLNCTHAALPIMRRQGSGHIVNVSSVGGRVAVAGAAVYNLTKFGVSAFSEALRQETRGSGIRVTAIEPGSTATELRSHNRPEIREQLDRSTADVQQMSADDIATAIVYALGQPPNVSVSSLLVRASGQAM
jgi:clavulanate-9-aldehyde reductase